MPKANCSTACRSKCGGRACAEARQIRPTHDIDMNAEVEIAKQLPWGGLAIDADGRIYLNGSRIELAPKEESVLYRLLIQWPNSVGKDEFAQHVWGGRLMSDESLARCVARARKALMGIQGVSIKALYGQGYVIEHVTGGRSPVPVHQAAFHRGFMAMARAPSQLAEIAAYCDTLIHLRTRFSLEQSERLLREVVEQDQSYIAAKVHLALCLAAQVTLGMGDGRPLVAEGLKMLETAMQNGENSSGLMTAYAHFLDCGWHFKEAQRFHSLALQQASDDAVAHYNYGWHCLMRGNLSKAVASLQTSYTLKPFSVATSIMYARALLAMKLEDRAAEVIEAMCERFPESAAAKLYWLSLQAFRSPRAELIAHANQVPVDKLAWPLCNANLAYIYARCGDAQSSWAAIHAQDDEGPTLRLSYIGALFLLGQTHDAFDRIEHALHANVSILPLMMQLPENFPHMVTHPRGQALLAAVAKRVC